MRLRKVICAICLAAMTLCTVGVSSPPVRAAAVTTINVTSYGADGSDLADDSDAFQKALDAAKGSSVPVTIVVPAGQYYIGTPQGKSARSLKIYSNTTLQLNSGAALLRQKNAPDIYMLEADQQKNITVSGGTFDGNAQTTTQAKGLVSFRSTDNIGFSGVTFRNFCGTHCVIVDGAQGLSVTNCTFKDFRPFTGSASAYTTQTSSNSYWSAEALHIDFVAPSGNSPGRNMGNITVSGCVFAGVPTGVGTHHVYDSLTADNIKIFNNTFTGCYYGGCNAANFKNFSFYSNKATNTPTLLRAMNTRGQVYNNTLDNSSYRPGTDIITKIYDFGSNRMELSGLSAFELYNIMSNSKINTTNSTTLEIYSNTVKTANYNGSTDSRICGIHGYYGAVINAHNNYITGAPYRGIYVDAGKATVSKNTLDKCKDSVYVSNSTNSSIAENTILNSAARAITAYKDNSITMTGNRIRKTTDGRGITLEGCTGTNKVISNTVLESTGFGIYVITSSVDQINSNTLGKGTTDAVTLNSSSSVARINQNHFFDNGGSDLYVTGNAAASSYCNNTSDKNAVRINSGSSVTTKTGNVPHTYSFTVKSIVNSTDKEPGYTEYGCSNCHFSYRSDFTVPGSPPSFDPLVNTSRISETSVSYGGTVKVTCASTGGAGTKQYAVWYKKSRASSWTTAKSYSTTTAATVKPQHTGTYSIHVKVKDCNGTVKLKSFSVTVKPSDLLNTSTLSTASVVKGGSFTVKCSATGGTGTRQYAVYYKKTSASSWTTKQNYSDTTSVAIKPSSVGVYDVCIRVKDEKGTVSKMFKTVCVNNSSSAFANKSTISATSVTKGTKITLKGVSANANGTALYRYEYKSEDASSYTTVKDYSSTASASFTPDKAGRYFVRVLAKDVTPTTKVKYFVVTVK